MTMIDITIHDDLAQIIPKLRLGCIQCEVHIAPSDEKIFSLSKSIVADVRSELSIETVSQKPTILSTKEAYRALGKDPSRYRPSAEALTRRVVNGKDLYQVNNIVDLLNLVSLESGFSIGGYDAEKIEGAITFGIGKENEPYQAIGRGDLNIAYLPLFRDEIGAFGSPTSDSLRTMVTDKTAVFLMIIIDFDHHENLQKSMDRSIDLLKIYGNATGFENKIVDTKAKT